MSTRVSQVLAALVGSAALFTVTLPAQAAVLTFDDTTAPALLSAATPLTAQYGALGVTFSGTGAVLNEVSDYLVTGYSGANFLAYNSEAIIGFGTANATSKAFDAFTFSTPLRAVSFLLGSGLTGPPSSVGRTVEVRAFNAAGIEVDMQSITLESALRMVSLSGMDITSVTLMASLDFEDEEGVGFVVDDITTRVAGEDVPEPVSLALMGSALAGLLVSRRRSRSRR